MINRKVIVQELPKGELKQDHFALQDSEMPVPGEGEVLVRTLLMSIDAANRSWMQGPTYREAVKAGDAMHTYALCEVMESRSDRLAPGDIVATETVWAEYAVRPGRGCEKLPSVSSLSQIYKTIRSLNHHESKCSVYQTFKSKQEKEMLCAFINETFEPCEPNPYDRIQKSVIQRLFVDWYYKWYADIRLYGNLIQKLSDAMTEKFGERKKHPSPGWEGVRVITCHI